MKGAFERSVDQTLGFMTLPGPVSPGKRVEAT